MKRRTSVALTSALALAAIPVIACSKANDSQGSSGSSLAASDKALFQYLPAGEMAFFGGNYLKLQNFMDTALGKASEKAMESAGVGSGMHEWMTCFTNLQQLSLVAGVGLGGADGKSAEMRMVFSGLSLDDLARCGQQANFKTTVDADHKFASVELPGPAGTAGYLVLPNGALYTRQAFALGTAPKVYTASRSELESDLTKLGATAADDPMLTSLASKVDRSKTVWFVGDAASTPVADKVGRGWGTIDLTPAQLAIDITIELKKSADADKLEKSIDEVHKMADQLPGDLKDVAKNLKFDRDGDRVQFSIAVSDAAIKNILSQYGSMLGTMTPH